VDYRSVRILSQEKPGATLKVAREPPVPCKNSPLYWIFDKRFIHDLPWDSGEWHWRSNLPLGGTPFYNYTAKRDYSSIRKTTHTSSMSTFLQSLHLRNTTIV
jgi:hypothetical protein